MPFVPTPRPDPNEIVWTTKAGEDLTMREISNDHMINIIRMLRRKAAQDLNEGHSFASFIQGEMALDALEFEIDRRQDAYRDKIEDFEAEAKRRGMDLSKI